MHEVLVNRLGGLSLPRKSVVRLTDRPDLTFTVGVKQQCNNKKAINITFEINTRASRYPFPMDRDGHDFHALFQYVLYVGTKLHAFVFLQ